MNRKWMLQRIMSLALCFTLAASACGAFSPAYAIGGTTVYTFGDVNDSFRDLYAEHQKEDKQREKERKKAEREQTMREKKAMKKAERETRERERREKPAKGGAEEGAN